MTPRGKTKSKAASSNVLPIAPWIYINDPTGNGEYAYELAAMMPKAEHIQLTQALSKTSPLFPLITDAEYREKIVVVTTNALCLARSTRYSNAQLVQQAAIKHGCNFASVNLVSTAGQSKPTKLENWGTNHLEISVTASADTAQIKVTAERIYKWLFGVLSVLEQLHLIPDEQMRQIDPNSSFSDYEYCPLKEARLRPRDQKLQFVALILTKPTVGPNNRISWQVADKTGKANFHFTHRGPSSQYTWDWVLALKPGDRKCLPRMSHMLVKERAFVTVVKAPFRITGGILRGTGFVVRGVGIGLSKVGKKVSLGQRSEWVPVVDVGTDARGRKYKIVRKNAGFLQYDPSPEKTEIKVFTAKGEKSWKDVDSVASTKAGSIMNEKSAD